MRTGARLAVIAVVGGAAAVGLAVAQSNQKRLPVPHEDLPAPNGDRVSPTIGATGSGNNPAAFTAGDKVLPEPSVDKPGARNKDQPLMGGGGFAADRDTTIKPDSNTGTDGTLHYVSVFNPDVLPFKRMSSLDGAGEDYGLKIMRPALVDVPVGGTTTKARDRFWGDLHVQLQPGVDVPLPSVSPDMRILSYKTEPRIQLKFTKDGADNFYVRSDESNAAGPYHLVFFADADANYFTPALPTSTRYTARMVATMTPPELRTALPDGVRNAAKRTLDKIGIDADMDLQVSFNKLIEFFRGFEAKELPQKTGDIYQDLCDSQAGVCRHRAFAFMVTANALGIPTRYVQNEAHAFVEVWFPERRWQRIDLGGAALRMDVTGAQNKTLHRPRADDPFAKPEKYKQSYTQLEGDIKGLTSQQIADKRKSLDESPPSGSIDGSSPGTGAGSNSRTAGPDRITPDPTLPTVSEDPAKKKLRLTVTLADSSAYRGDVVHVEGLVAGPGNKGVPDHAVDVFLAPAGRNGANPIPLGRTVSDASGRFTQDFTVPSTLNLATYEIYLASPEDAYFNAALSN